MSNEVVNTIPVASGAFKIAVHPSGTRVYVRGAITVAVIDTVSNQLIDSVNVGNGGAGVAVTPDGTRVYVGNAAEGTVSVIDTASNTVVHTVDAGNGPRGVAVSPDGASVYVSNIVDDSVSVIETATNAVTDVVSVGENPGYLAIISGPPLPDCLGAEPSLSFLWPPNHHFVPISVLGVTDLDGDVVTITIDSIYQDEAVDSEGSGNTTPDGRGVGTSTAEIRAERVGSHNGRVYHIGFTAESSTGGMCSGEVNVGVPRDLWQNAVPIDDGTLYDSTVVP